MERHLADHAVRAALRQDLDAIERLENAAFETDRLSRRSLRYFLGAATTGTLVAEGPAGLLGYAMIGFRRRSYIGRVFSLAVDRGAARRGVGRALLRACEGVARRRGRSQVRLEVRADNDAAIGLYESEGYVRLGLTAGYYEDGASALHFGKIFGPEHAA